MAIVSLILPGGSGVAAASSGPPPKPTIYTRNPIITVTEHTPTPSPDYLRRQGSIDSQLDVLSQMGGYSKVHMLRSHTDSHIAYNGADEIEAPGSSFYITPEGGIDYEVLLLVSRPTTQPAISPTINAPLFPPHSTGGVFGL